MGIKAPVKVPWWSPNLLVAGLSSLLLRHSIKRGPTALIWLDCSSWYTVALLLHTPYILILCFLCCGIVEHVGYFFRRRSTERKGRLPSPLPKVCVQLPMYNEQAVAERAIEAACTIDWPLESLEVQVLDDSTDPEARRIVESVCTRMASCGYNCQLMRRQNRSGYKAGALEVGRHKTEAELIAILDADFVPGRNYLHRAVPYFFDENGRFIKDLALVQSQWGHLNHDESNLTAAQSLWVDDHHTIQMSWRSATWGFVNFTGTAGIWKASAIHRAGGWRSASLVEDCELSFRHLFAGYNTRFVKEIVVPAELPDTYTAYKAQQKRWTQGWVQLQRLHLRRLLLNYKTGLLRKLHLIYHITISWQWCLWGLWLLVQPYAVANSMWLGEMGIIVGALVYAVPSLVYLLFFTAAASLETRHTYTKKPSFKIYMQRFYRLVPYAVLNTAMLPHQFTSFSEGLFGAMNAEFERTPKTASVSGEKHTKNTQAQVKVHFPYVAAEVFFFVYNVGWTLVFLRDGKVISACSSCVVALSVAAIFWFYGDHIDRRLFVIPCKPSTTKIDSEEIAYENSGTARLHMIV